MPFGKRRLRLVGGRHDGYINGMQPIFSGWHTQLFIISDLYRHPPPEIAEAQPQSATVVPYVYSSDSGETPRSEFVKLRKFS